MDTAPPIDRAIRKFGTAIALARHLRVSASSITNWRRDGIPAERVLDVEAATGVSRHELRPDLYPPPGHPRHLPVQAA